MPVFMHVGSQFNKSVFINSTSTKVWAVLTQPALMQQSMSETVIRIVIDWKIGKPFIILVPWYKSHFENKGIPLQFDPEKDLQYSQLGSLSRLPEAVELLH